MLTNSKIDKIGQQLKAGNPDAQCLIDLEEFRGLYRPAYAFVERVLVEGMNLKITGRPSKSTVAIVEKLRRESSRLNQIQDIAGCRVLCTDLATQRYFVGVMEVLLGDVAIDDKLEQPTNGYRAIHVIARRHGRPVEVQVRTALQHAWAEISEKLADKHGHSIKYGQGNATVLDFLRRLSELTRELDLIRERRKATSEEKVARGKNKDVLRRAKDLNSLENECLRRVRGLFSEFEGVV